MPTLSTLPTEVLRIVIEDLVQGWLPLADLRYLSLVSKQMREVAFPSLNTSYILRSKNHIHRFCSRIEREADASYRDLRLADVLKEIKGDDNLAGNFGRETFHHLTAALRYLPYLESFSCIDWTPEYPGDLFPIMVNLCPKMRKLEVGLIPQARPMGFNGEHVNSYDEYDNAVFGFSNLTHIRVVTSRYVTHTRSGDVRLSASVPSALLRMLDRCPSLQSLDIHLDVWDELALSHWQPRDLLWNGATSSLRQWPDTLRKFEIGLATSDKILTNFLASHPNLEELAIIDPFWMDSSIVQELVLQPGSLPHLTVLKGPPRICNSVLSQMPEVQLQSLWVTEEDPKGSNPDEYGGLGPDFDFNTELIAQKCPTVTNLLVASNYNMSLQTLKPIVKAMPMLDRLHLHNCVGESKAQVERFLKSIPNLRSINMSFILSPEDIDISTRKKVQRVIHSVAAVCPGLQFIEGDYQDTAQSKGILIRHQAGQEPHFNNVSKRWLSQQMVNSQY